jgi:Zn finger protein HypA/HybF involved in hydrogenase expression
MLRANRTPAITLEDASEALRAIAEGTEDAFAGFLLDNQGWDAEHVEAECLLCESGVDPDPIGTLVQAATDLVQCPACENANHMAFHMDQLRTALKEVKP